MFGAIAAMAGAGLASGLIGAEGAKDAAKSQAGAAAAATAEQRRQFNIGREDLAPYRQAGQGAVSALSQLLGLPGSTPSLARSNPTEFLNQVYQKYLGRTPDASGLPFYSSKLMANEMTPEEVEASIAGSPEAQGRIAQGFVPQGGPIAGTPAATVNGTGSVTDSPLLRKFTQEDLESDPVYKNTFNFGLSEGEKAVRRMFGAQGLARSGAAVKGVTRFASDYAGQSAGASRGRFIEDQNNIYNRLAGIAGTGQTASANTAQLGANMATNVGQNMMGAANARGAASIASANALAAPFAQAGNMMSTKFLLDSLKT